MIKGKNPANALLAVFFLLRADKMRLTSGRENQRHRRSIAREASRIGHTFFATDRAAVAAESMVPANGDVWPEFVWLLFVVHASSPLRLCL